MNIVYWSFDCLQQKIEYLKSFQKCLLFFSLLKRDKLLFVEMPRKLEKLWTNFSPTDNTPTSYKVALSSRILQCEPNICEVQEQDEDELNILI